VPFEPRFVFSVVSGSSCLYDSYRRLTWSLISGPVGLVEVHASWPRHPR
jgi:hypothetical protein